MRFEWDEAKDRANRRKHGVSFQTAARVFADADRVEVFDRHVNGEDRWHVIGFSAESVRLMLVVCTFRGNNGEEVVRIISARPASDEEEQLYGNG